MQHNMLCKKTSAITYEKIGPVTPGSDPRGCVARGAGCLRAQKYEFSSDFNPIKLLFNITIKTLQLIMRLQFKLKHQC